MLDSSESFYCSKCNRTKKASNFYLAPDNKPYKLCKECATMHINIFEPSSYTWLLEALDLVYVPEEWNKVVNKELATKELSKIKPGAVFGKYIARIKLNQFKGLHWADSQRLQEEKEQRLKEQKEQIRNYSEDLKNKFDAGEISEYEYKTLASTELQLEEQIKLATVDPKDFVTEYGTKEDQEIVKKKTGKAKKNTDIENNNETFSFYDESQYIPEEDIPDASEELNQEDKIYLATKWGRLYKPSQLLKLEELYWKFSKSFELNDADSINTVMLICKTYLKMDEALDAGDIDGYQKLSRVYDSMRKSTKLTAAQNKDGKDNSLMAIGRAIKMCEEDGFIPRYATDIPQDKVDFTLKDMNNYIHNLVTKDLGFGDQIDNAIKMLKLRKEEDEKENIEEDAIVSELKDKDFEEWFEEQEAQRLADIEEVEKEINLEEVDDYADDEQYSEDS